MSAVIVALVAGVFAGALVVWLVTRGQGQVSPAVMPSRGENESRLDDTLVQVQGAEPRSLQALIWTRRQGEFTARRAQLIQYLANLTLPVDDERRWLLLNIYGDADVDKGYFLNQLQRIAKFNGHLTAYIDEGVYDDESVYDATSLMCAISREFSRDGVHLREFEKRAAAYRRCRRTLDSEKGVPAEVTAIVAKVGITLGVYAASAVPLAGGFLASVGPAAISDQANRTFDYLTKMFDSYRDAELLLSPADELTRTFVDNVKRAARDRPISLFFGGYEHAAPLLDRWLLRLYDGRYGYLPETLITTISGRYPLDPKSWRRHRTITAYMHPEDAGDVRGPSGDPRERYLKWERDPDRRAMAVTGALARTFNQDTLAVLTSAGNVAELFGWLIGLPFVSQQPASWKYHEGVRSDMIRFQRAQSPSDWRTNHLALARAHARWAVEAAGSPDPAWANQDWVDHTVERTYHLLCADPVGNRLQALTSAVMAQASKTARARQWAELFADAGRDTENRDLRQLGERLDEGSKDGDLTRYLTYLIDDGGLSESALAVAFSQRGEAHLRATRDGRALADFSRAAELDPGLAPAVAGRGLAYLSMGRNDKALTDFNRALGLNPDLASAVAGHAVIYMEMTRFHEALAALNRALELDPELDWAFAFRGLVHTFSGRPAEALADLDRAIELDPNESGYIAIRAMISMESGRPAEDALADLNRVMELDPNESGYIVIRAMISMESGRPEDALADLNRVMELDPNETRHIAIRGMISLTTGHFDEAFADLDRAVECSPDRAMPLFFRGITHLERSQFGEALADFNRALELAPDLAWALASRGLVNLKLGRLDEAFADLDRALEFDPDSAETIAARGQAYYEMKRYEEALVDLNRALELDPDLALALVFRGRSYWALSRYDEAAIDFGGASELNPANVENMLLRIQTYSAVTRADEVFADLGLIEFNPGNEEHRFAVLALFCAMLGYFDEALADLDHVIELDPDNVRWFFLRCFIYLQIGCRGEALADFNRARAYKPELVYPPELTDERQTASHATR